MTVVAVDWLTDHVTKLFVAAGLEPPAAATVADALVDADRRGVPSHGVLLVPMYLERLGLGSVTTRTAADVVVDAGAIAVLDAGHALGQLTGDQAMGLAIEKAERYGIGAVGVRRAFHFGAAGRYVRTAAAAGMVGYAAANTRPLMPAPGGGRAVVGNNPIAIGIPAGDQEPIVLDMALSEVALGRIRLAVAEGAPIPGTWATDPDGLPTTDPATALAGMLLPIAGYKGFGLALVVEVLTGVLSGGAFGEQVRGLYTDTAVPNDCAHFFLALNVAAFGDRDRFDAGVRDLADAVSASPRAPGADGVRLPGQRSAERFRSSAADGVPVDDAVLARLRELEGVVS